MFAAGELSAHKKLLNQKAVRGRRGGGTSGGGSAAPLMSSIPRRPDQRRSSLARESGVFTSLVISISIIFGHVLFGYAQASGLNTECNAPAGDACEQGGQMSISGGGLFRGEIKGRVAFEAHRALALALAAVEGASCQALIDCPNGALSPVHLPASTADLCTVLECGGASLDQTVFQ